MRSALPPRTVHCSITDFASALYWSDYHYCPQEFPPHTSIKYTNKYIRPFVSQGHSKKHWASEYLTDILPENELLLNWPQDSFEACLSLGLQ